MREDTMCATDVSKGKMEAREYVRTWNWPLRQTSFNRAKWKGVVIVKSTSPPIGEIRLLNILKLCQIPINSAQQLLSTIGLNHTGLLTGNIELLWAVRGQQTMGRHYRRAYNDFKHTVWLQHKHGCCGDTDDIHNHAVKSYQWLLLLNVQRMCMMMIIGLMPNAAFWKCKYCVIATKSNWSVFEDARSIPHLYVKLS